jgi:hypothetical protein
MSFDEILFKYISDLENIPLSIHRIWDDFSRTITDTDNTIDKHKFIQIFHELSNTYPNFRLIYHRGCPFILNTKKDLWEIKQSEYKVPDYYTEITDSDILSYYIDHEDETVYRHIPKNFVVKIIEDREFNNLKMILEYFKFTDEDFDLFLSVANDKRCSNRSNDLYGDILLYLTRSKYEMNRSEFISKKNELENSYHQMKSKYDNMKFHFKILKENENEANFIKTTFFYSLILSLAYNLYLYL